MKWTIYNNNNPERGRKLSPDIRNTPYICSKQKGDPEIAFLKVRCETTLSPFPNQYFKITFSRNTFSRAWIIFDWKFKQFLKRIINENSEVRKVSGNEFWTERKITNTEKLKHNTRMKRVMFYEESSVKNQHRTTCNRDNSEVNPNTACGCYGNKLLILWWVLIV